MEIKEADFLAAWENHKLVRGALKAAHVSPGYRDYEDLLQEGIVVYAQMLADYPQMPREELDRLSFRKVLWATLDRLRRHQRDSEHNRALTASDDIFAVSDWDSMIVLQQASGQMTPLERVIFCEHLLAGKSITALARQTGISRVHLQRCKRQLLASLRQLLTK